jgi:amino acid transporter
MENNNKEKKKKLSDKTIRVLKLVALYLAIVGVLFFLVFMVFSIISTFPDYVPITNADSLLQIWITTNGVIMGFVGIIFAQLISSTMDQQNTLYQRILEEELSNKHRTKQLKKKLNYLDNRKFALSMFTVVSLGLLAYSILLSMQAIAKNSQYLETDVYAVQGFMFNPLLFTVLGITAMIVALTLPSKPPLEEALQS